jgi:hypothetical protein
MLTTNKIMNEQRDYFLNQYLITINDEYLTVSQINDMTQECLKGLFSVEYIDDEIQEEYSVTYRYGKCIPVTYKIKKCPNGGYEIHFELKHKIN